MKYLLPLIILLLTSCSENIKISKVGKCYKADDVAIKVIGEEPDGTYYYKHSWNSQNSVFNKPRFAEYWEEISCGKDGYEWEILQYDLAVIRSRVKSLEQIVEQSAKKQK